MDKKELHYGVETGCFEVYSLSHGICIAQPAVYPEYKHSIMVGKEPECLIQP